MKRKLLTLILAGMLSISAIACGSSNSDATEQSESGTDATEESTDAEEEEAAESSEPAIMEQYTQLENGMSYDEVKKSWARTAKKWRTKTATPTPSLPVDRQRYRRQDQSYFPG